MKCPSCASARVYPSQLRGSYERLRHLATDKQPYRCHACGWRKWIEVHVHPDSPDVHPDDLRTGRVPKTVSPSDLDQLDSSIP